MSSDLPGLTVSSALTAPPVDLVGATRVRVSAARTTDTGVVLETSHGAVSVESIADGVFRLRAGSPAPTDYGILAASPAADGSAEVTRSGDSILIRQAGCSLELGLAGDLSIELLQDGQRLTSQPTDAHFTGALRYPLLSRLADGWLLGLDLATHEPMFGLGERYAGIEVRGALVDGWNEDALGVNTARSYKQVPFAWSARGWGVFIHTPARVSHAVGHADWSHRSYLARVYDDELDVFLICATTPAQMLERYTQLTGRTPPLPRWSLGPWMSRAYYRDAQETLRVAREIRERGMPCDVITLDGRAWLDTDTRFGFDWDRSRIADPRALTRELHELGFKICAWEYPLISERHPLYAHYAERGWLLRTSDGKAPYRFTFDSEPFGKVLTQLPDSGIVDFTHPGAYADWRNRHQALFDDGIDFFKSDFGEQVPLECLAANGDTGARLHNSYTLLYNRCVFEATAAAHEQPFVFARSAYAGAQRYPVHWGGDPQADWGGLAASIRGALSWGLSGGATYAHDIGGFYADRRDPELYLRWLQVAVFGSHLRFHGVGEREPWSYGEDVSAIAMAYLKLRSRLAPYLHKALEQASATGLPVMRAMPLAFPDEPAAWRYDTQFCCGDALLVATVIEAGGKVQAWLPEGEWLDLWTGEAVSAGGALELAVPLDRIPVWVRRSAGFDLGVASEVTDLLQGSS